jgi:hypothetical protein
MENTLTLPNEFTSYEHFCGVVVNQIFEEKNITDKIEEIDGESDMSRRIFVLMEDGREYIIRTWNIHDDDDYAYVDYTLYLEDTDFDTVIEL